MWRRCLSIKAWTGVQSFCGWWLWSSLGNTFIFRGSCGLLGIKNAAESCWVDWVISHDQLGLGRRRAFVDNSIEGVSESLGFLAKLVFYLLRKICSTNKGIRGRCRDDVRTWALLNVLVLAIFMLQLLLLWSASWSLLPTFNRWLGCFLTIMLRTTLLSKVRFSLDCLDQLTSLTTTGSNPMMIYWLSERSILWHTSLNLIYSLLHLLLGILDYRACLIHCFHHFSIYSIFQSK